MRGRGSTSACCSCWPSTRSCGCSKRWKPAPAPGRFRSNVLLRWFSGWPSGTRVCLCPWGPRRRKSRCPGRTWDGSMSCSETEKKQMANDRYALLRANLKQLRLPTMALEFEKLAREAAAGNEGFEQFLLRLTEMEGEARVSESAQDGH